MPDDAYTPLEEAARAATPGPWGRYHDHDEDSAEVVCHAPGSPDYLGQVVVRPAPTEEMSQGNVAHDDTAYIAAFDPETTGRLLDQLAAAEQEVAALRDLVQGLVTHADIAVNSSEWYGPDDRIRAEALIEAAKAHLRGDVANPPAGGAS